MCDNPVELPTVMARPGNDGSNTAADPSCDHRPRDPRPLALQPGCHQRRAVASHAVVEDLEKLGDHPAVSLGYSAGLAPG